MLRLPPRSTSPNARPPSVPVRGSRDRSAGVRQAGIADPDGSTLRTSGRRTPRRPEAEEAPLRVRRARPLVLAFVSWVFGVMMAVARTCPTSRAGPVRRAQNSVVYDRDGPELATLTGNENRILLESDEISPVIKQAVVAIEDQRFYEHRGIDYLGIARALERTSSPASASRAARRSPSSSSRTRSRRRATGPSSRSSARRRSPTRSSASGRKDKILTNYLNNIYFGEGAYGIEAAARTYFGADHPGLRRRRRTAAPPSSAREAAMLAGADLLAERLLAASNPDRRARPSATSCCEDARAGLLQPEQYDEAFQTARSRRPRRSSRRPRTPRPPTSPTGCASSSSTSTAPARRSAAG